MKVRIDGKFKKALMKRFPGWTEHYGWLHKGKWQEDFFKLVEKHGLELAEDHRKILKIQELKRLEKKQREKNLLSRY